MAEDFIQSPPDSSGKRVHTVMVNDGQNDIYTPVHIIADGVDPTHRQSVDSGGSAFTRFAEGSPVFDAFGLMGTSEPSLMGVFKFYEGTQDPRFHKIVTGTADAVDDPALGGTKVTTGTANGDKLEYYSNRRYMYRPGSTISLEFTMKAGDVGKAGLNRHIGWFNDTDYMVFAWEGTDQYVAIKGALTGVEVKVPRANWSGDRLDGSGGDNNLSEVTLDVTKTNIWWIDYQFLGSGVVRFGTWIGGVKVTCHVMNGYNALDRPYLSDPNMAFGVKQENTALVGSTSEMYVFCGAVTGSGYPEYPVTPTSLSVNKVINSTSFTPAFSVRASELLGGTNNRCRLRPLHAILISDGGAMELKAEFNPVLTGATWTESADGLEWDLGATVATPVSSSQVSAFIGANIPYELDLTSMFPPHGDGLYRGWDITEAGYFTVSLRLLAAGTSNAGVGVNFQIQE